MFFMKLLQVYPRPPVLNGVSKLRHLTFWMAKKTFLPGGALPQLCTEYFSWNKEYIQLKPSVVISSVTTFVYQMFV